MYKRITIDQISDKGCENVLIELLRVVGMDYNETLKQLHYHPGDKFVIDRIRNLEEFIRSDYFGKLTGLDGELIIEKLRKYSYETMNRSRVEKYLA